MTDKPLSIPRMGRITFLPKKMSSCMIEEFMQYFTATIVLVVGLFLFSTNMNSFSRKIFFHSYVMNIKIDDTFFNMPALFFSVPCFFLTTRLYVNTRRIFKMLICLHVIGTIALIAGYSVGMKYQPKFSNDTLRMGFTIPKQYINNTLYNLIAEYGNNIEYKNSIDKIQSKLQCCGVLNEEDFVTIPDSCCPKEDCQKSEPYQIGCLIPMQDDIAWYRNVTVSLAPVGILLYLFNATMATAVYVSYYYKWKETILEDEEMRKKCTD